MHDHYNLLLCQVEGKDQVQYAAIQKSLKELAKGWFLLAQQYSQNLIKKNMIRQYDFPRIFQNVVGEVIPLSLRNKQITQRIPLAFSGQLQEISNSCNSSSNAPADNGILYVKSKKKKLLRRLKFNKTSSCFSGKQGKSDEDKLSQKENSTILRNFLKRKQLTVQKTEKLSSRLEKDEIFEKNDQQDEMRSNLAQGLSSKRNTKFRQRTSFERHFILQNNKDINSHIKFQHRTSQADNTSTKQLQSQSTPRSKPKHKTFFKFDLISEEKQHSKIDQVQINRKKSKKKTVNFVIQDQKQNQETEHMRVDSPRRGTKVQRTFIEKSSKFTGKSTTPHKDQKFDHSQDKHSKWSAKSVVSIKFTSSRRIKSKKTLRSQHSIFDDDSHFMSKRSHKRYRHRANTQIRFPHMVTSFKSHKSMISLSQASIDPRSDWSIGRSKRKEKHQQQQTNKSIVSIQSKNLIEKKTKMQSKVSILIKSNNHFKLSETQHAIKPIKSSTFQDIVFKKKKTIITATRLSTDPDAFAQLNNFHKFLNDSLIDDNDQDMQKNLTKPAVIDSSIGHRQIRNPKMLKEENLMIDMGLKMIKKMSILRQKKF